MIRNALHSTFAIAAAVAAALLLPARAAQAEERNGFRVVDHARHDDSNEDEEGQWESDEPDEDEDARDEEADEEEDDEGDDEDEDAEEESDEDEGDEEDEEDEEEADDEPGEDDEGDEDEAEPEPEATDRSSQREVDPSDPWSVRVTPWPLFELTLVAAPIIRLFNLPIDRELDGTRSMAHLETGYFGVIGFQLGLFPFARFRPIALRGLGAEWSACFAVGLEQPDLGAGVPVDASYREFDLNLAYNVFLGRLDVGGQIMVRLGWHNTDFYLGDVGNDIVAPFEYDAVRFEIGARVPLRTRHLVAEARGSYLLVTSVGSAAAEAYGQEGATPSTQGGEVRLGVIARVGGLELDVTYIGRWFSTTFEGDGYGFGIDRDSTDAVDLPTTIGRGIRTTAPAKDSFQQIRLGLGYRW
jgi:hypothetical protein